MPVYNAGRYLDEAIASIIDQTYEDFEFLIIDDGSSDRSSRIIAQFAARDSRIRFIQHENNIGLAATLGEGLTLAKGEYIARMDQDDVSAPERLAVQSAYLDQHPKVAVAGSWAANIGVTPLQDRLVRLPIDHQAIRQSLERENCIYHPTVMFRRNEIRALGGYRSRFKNAEDYDLWLRVSRVYEIVNLPVSLVRYRLSTGGMTLGRKWEQLRYTLLAQSANADPNLPLDQLDSRVDQKLAQTDRGAFFDGVAEHAVTELIESGWLDQAAVMVEALKEEITPECLSKLAAKLPVSPEPRGDDSRVQNLLQAGLAALVFLIPGLVWIIRDRSVWEFDPSWYGEVSVDLWWTFAHRLSDWPQAMWSVFGSKAPGVAWLGQWFVPLGSWLGRVELGLLASVWITQFVTLMLIFDLGRRLADGRRLAGWLAVGLFATASLNVGLANYFFVEPLQTLAVTYFLWMAQRSHRWPLKLIIPNVILGTAVAMIAKATSPLYLLAPAVLIVYNSVRTVPAQPRIKVSRFSSASIWIIAGFTISCVVTWYAQNMQALVEFVQFSSSSEMALHYGSVGTLQTKLSFWLNATRSAFWAPAAYWPLLGAMLLASILLLWKRHRSVHNGSRWYWVTAGLIQVAVILFIFSRQINEETRYLLPMLPHLVVGLVALMSLTRSTWVYGLAGVAVLFQAWSVHPVAHGWTPADGQLSPWLKPLDLDALPQEEVTRIVAATTPVDVEWRYSVNGLELQWLNANVLAFYAAKLRLDIDRRNYYTSLGYAVTDAEAAWQRMQDMQSLYFITRREELHEQPPNFLNQVAVDILRRVDQAGEFEAVPFSSEMGVLIYRRR